jgi:hypothetical protein
MESNDLKWFNDRLDDDYHDRELENDGYEIDFYWDTSDVREAILGAAAYYDADNAFLRRKFDSDEALIRCLAATGWLGTIRLLQPHQSELLRLVDSDFGVGPVGLPSGGLNRFVEDSGLKSSARIDFTSLSTMSQERVIDLVRDQAGNAPTLFKVVHCAKRTWRARLAVWVRDKTLGLDDQSIDYSTIVTHSHFDSLREAFDEERPHTPVNNFTDAVAICLLADKARDYQTTGRVPRFFVSTPLYKRVLAKTQLNKLLTYTYKKRDMAVLRGKDYYRFRATLHPPTRLRSQQYEDELKSLFGVHEQVKEILAAQKPLDRAALSSLGIGQRPLEEVILSLRRFWFLENVWLPYAAGTELIEAAREYVETAKQLQESPEFRQGMELEIQRTKSDLARNSEEFQSLGRFWREMEEAISKVQPHFPRIGRGSVDYYRTAGLMRFGFPKEERMAVETTLAALLGGEQQARDEARRNLIVQSRRVRSLSTAREGDITVFTAVMWALRMDYQLVDVASSHVASGRCHYSVKIVLAAAQLRLRNSSNEVALAIEELRTEFVGAADSKTKFDLAVGLGYLCFHLWELKCPTGRRGSAALRDEEAEKCNESLIVDAIRYAEAASFGSTGYDNEKSVYAWNQFLYYSCVAPDGVPVDWNKINQAANRLTLYLGRPDVWQYRFDDTLAHYYERCADLAGVEGRGWLVRAKEAVQRAWDSAYGDDEVLRHREQLLNHIETSELMFPR